MVRRESVMGREKVMDLVAERPPEKSSKNIVHAVSADRLYRSADLAALTFQTTADLPPLEAMADQPRARDALALGLGARRRGFHIFVTGAGTAGMRRSVLKMLEDAAATHAHPLDWVYVNNFFDPQKPHCLPLPYGRAREFQKAVHDLIDELKVSLPSLFESEEYQKRRSAIEESVRRKGEEAIEALQKQAAEKNIAILRGPMGLFVAPSRDGNVVPPAEFNAWPEAQKEEMRSAIEGLQKELEATLRRMPRLQKEMRDLIRALDREIAQVALTQPFEELKAEYSELPEVLTHVGAIHTDMLKNIPLLMGAESEEDTIATGQPATEHRFERYEVNVLVTQSDHADGAPVIEELHPTLANLEGRAEYVSMHGVLVTNFQLIRAGALHRANGGIIVMDARNLLTEPFSWAALKRALSRDEIVIEDVTHVLGLTTTASLEPEPIPLNVKVVLLGDRFTYQLLMALDPEFGEQFKVLADFDDEVSRSREGEQMLARLIARFASDEKLKPLDREAVTLLVERASRIAEDATKLTLLAQRLRDVMAEADYWAEQGKRSVTSRTDVAKAIEEGIRRTGRLKERSQEALVREIALVETSGRRTGQINGLSVISTGDMSFGVPGRITCRVRPGMGKIVDIEREVKLGGPLHSKGVLILAGFLAGRYALDTPMSLYASLVLEQSYGAVEGDSASAAELFALLSALADVPLRQDLAVTGSVNQLGDMQAIGGVNEKIEGFFDLCHARGLTGTQGVLIPKSNVQHLMLREDVVDACSSGKFAIYAVETMDAGIALLTELDAGERGSDGRYPAGSLNARVEERLRQFAEIRRTTAGEAEG